jgi:hypothetical protein
MEDERSKSSEPSWLDPRNDRKTPYSDAELERLTDDQIAMLADTPAWRNLVADVGKERAREFVKERLMAPRSEQLGQLAARRPRALICVRCGARRDTKLHPNC